MKKERSRAVLIQSLLLAVALPLAALPAPGQLQTVRLQLKWLHQFQFAGFYEAAAQGFYRDEGLEVVFVEGQSDMSYTDEVVSGRADYGINNTDLLLDRSRGKPVVVLGVVFQHSPLILLSLASSGIRSPSDLGGKRIMVSADAEAEIYSMLSSEGIDRAAVGLKPHSWRLEDLVEGRVDAISAYSTNEPLALSRRGLAWRAISPLSYGIDFYGDCIFTSEAELRKAPARAAAFLRASLRGWEYAMAHVEEAASLIAARYATTKSREELVEEAEAMRSLILPDLVPLGFMNPGRWQHIGDTYAKLGEIPASFSLEGFLYDPAPRRLDRRTLIVLALVFLTGLFVMALYIATLRSFNRRLARVVAARTASLEELNKRLEAEIAEGVKREKLVAKSLAQKEILLREVHHRVKNNLQIILSILNLQLGREGGEAVKEVLREIRTRIFGMALVHEQLYESGDLGEIDMEAYFRLLVAEIMSIYSSEAGEVEAVVEAKDMLLPVDEAIPLGLIVGELVTNSLQHAFRGREGGRISLSFRDEGDLRLLVLGDDGIGRPSEGGNPKGLGGDLVDALCRQLGGSFRYLSGKGCVAELRFPASPASGQGGAWLRPKA